MQRLVRRQPSLGEKARHLEPCIQPALIPFKECVFARMVCCFPLWWPSFVVKRLRPAEGSVIGRVSRLNPHLPAMRAIENQDTVDRAPLVADCENSVFLRNRLPLFEQSAIIFPLPFVGEPLVRGG